MHPKIASSLLILLLLLAGCLGRPASDQEDEADAEGLQDPWSFTFEMCGGHGNPDGPFLAFGCPEFLDEVELTEGNTATLQVPYNSTGILARFSIGPAAGQAEIHIDVDTFQWQTHFDGPFALTAHGDGVDRFNGTSRTWFHQYVGSVCQVESLTIRAETLGTYTTLKAAIYALDPGHDAVLATQNLTVKPSCNGYWEGAPEPIVTGNHPVAATAHLPRRS